MLFRIVNYYDSENDEKIEEINEPKKETDKQENECFICFDFQLDNNDTIKLKNYTDFYKFCDCDGYIHVNCLNSWYEKNQQCPICRNPVKRADSIELYNLYQYQYGVYMIYFFLVVKRRLANSLLFVIKLTHRMFFILFFYIIFNMINEVYNSIIYELEKEIYDNYLLDNYSLDNYSLDNYKEPFVNRIIPLP